MDKTPEFKDERIIEVGDEGDKKRLRVRATDKRTADRLLQGLREFGGKIKDVTPARKPEGAE